MRASNASRANTQSNFLWIELTGENFHCLVGRWFLRQNIFFEHLLFAVDQGVDIVRCEFEPVPVRDRVRWASFHAITAENAARIINVVYRRVPLSCGDAVRVRILGSFNINAIRRAGGSAQETSNALFQAIFIAMQHVNPAIARLEMYRLVWVVLRDRFTEDILEGHAEALDHRRKCREHFADWISHSR